MGTFGRFLARPSTTRMLLSMRLEFAAIDADERRRIVEQIPQPHEGVKATLRGAQISRSQGQRTERIEDGLIQFAHDGQPTARPYADLRKVHGETFPNGGSR